MNLNLVFFGFHFLTSPDQGSHFRPNELWFVKNGSIGISDGPDPVSFEQPFIAASIISKLRLMADSIDLNCDKSLRQKKINEHKSVVVDENGFPLISKWVA